MRTWHGHALIDKAAQLFEDMIDRFAIHAQSRLETAVMPRVGDSQTGIELADSGAIQTREFT